MRKGLMVVIFLLLLGCGGGEGEGEGDDLEPISLNRASSYAELMAILESDFPQSLVDRWSEYEDPIFAPESVFNWAQKTDIIDGRYFVYVDPSEPVFNVYPQAIGKLELLPSSFTNQGMSYSDVDLNNQAITEGEFEAFYGVKGVELVGGQITVPTLIIIRVTVPQL